MNTSAKKGSTTGRGGGLMRRITTGAVTVREGMDAMAGRVNGLRKRVDALEQEVQEQRALSMRVAQLTDIVQELLIPVADRDEQRLRELLEQYQKTL